MKIITILTFNHVKFIKSILLAAALLLVSACSSKPPGCAEPETIKLFQTILTDNILKGLGTLATEKNDPNGMIATRMKALKIELTAIVNEGYNAEAKKQSCRGTLKLSGITDEVVEQPVTFITQKTESKNDDFLLEIDQIQPVIEALTVNISSYYYFHRWAGEWSGDYSCLGIDGATEGLQGPFISSVVLKVPVGTLYEGTLERVTKTGGVEKLVARMGNQVTLNGTGQNTPDDGWTVHFDGTISGKVLRAQGKIEVKDSPITRQCSLELTHAFIDTK
ncbi:MAG: hypothetical protein Q7T62_06435 [Undibacterium sp.]|nr:hypothetical protein [Undibacterium sp.]